MKHLKFGPPLMKVTVDGVQVTLTDDHGLLVDPRHYAKPGCNVCRGHGAYFITPSSGQAKGNKQMTPCSCARRGYDRARKAVLAAAPTVLQATAIFRFLGDLVRQPDPAVEQAA